MQQIERTARRSAYAPSTKALTSARGAGRDVAIPIGRVEEIVCVRAITRVPRAAADDVDGVINLRGHVLPVIELASRLGLGNVERTRQARVVRNGTEGVDLPPR